MVGVITPLIQSSGYTVPYVCIIIRQRNVKINLGKTVLYENRFHMSEGRVTDKCIIISQALPEYVDPLRNNSAWYIVLLLLFAHVISPGNFWNSKRKHLHTPFPARQHLDALCRYRRCQLVWRSVLKFQTSQVSVLTIVL